jgi:hypothetical protein
MTTIQGFKYTDVELRQVGIEALLQRLGYAETLRFLSQINAGEGDYLEWRERTFAGMTVDQIFDEAKEHFERKRD